MISNLGVLLWGRIARVRRGARCRPALSARACEAACTPPCTWSAGCTIYDIWFI